MNGFGITILLVYLLMLGGLLLISLTEYILQGIGLYKLAQIQGSASPWMAFVPWLRTYLYGKTAGPISFGKKEMKNPGVWMVAVPLAFGAVIGVSYFVMILSAAVGAIGNVAFAGPSIFIMFVWFLIFGIIVIGVMVYTAFISVLRGMVNYHIYKRFAPESKAVLHVLLSLFVPMYQAVYLFLLGRHVQAESEEQL